MFLYFPIISSIICGTNRDLGLEGWATGLEATGREFGETIGFLAVAELLPLQGSDGGAEAFLENLELPPEKALEIIRTS